MVFSMMSGMTPENPVDHLNALPQAFAIRSLQMEALGQAGQAASRLKVAATTFMYPMPAHGPTAQ